MSSNNPKTSFGFPDVQSNNPLGLDWTDCGGPKPLPHPHKESIRGHKKGAVLTSSCMSARVTQTFCTT
jgi:hypothetical protein